MSGENTNFDDEMIYKSSFYKKKKLFNIYDVNVNKISVSKKEPNVKKISFKQFIRYDYHDYFGP